MKIINHAFHHNNNSMFNSCTFHSHFSINDSKLFLVDMTFKYAVTSNELQLRLVVGKTKLDSDAFIQFSNEKKVIFIISFFTSFSVVHKNEYRTHPMNCNAFTISCVLFIVVFLSLPWSWNCLVFSCQYIECRTLQVVYLPLHSSYKSSSKLSIFTWIQLNWCAHRFY